MSCKARGVDWLGFSNKQKNDSIHSFLPVPGDLSIDRKLRTLLPRARDIGQLPQPIHMSMKDRQGKARQNNSVDGWMDGWDDRRMFSQRINRNPGNRRNYKGIRNRTWTNTLSTSRASKKKSTQKVEPKVGSIHTIKTRPRKAQQSRTDALDAPFVFVSQWTSNCWIRSERRPTMDLRGQSTKCRPGPAVNNVQNGTPFREKKSDSFIHSLVRGKTRPKNRMDHLGVPKSCSKLPRSSTTATSFVRTHWKQQQPLSIFDQVLYTVCMTTTQ